MVEYRSPKPRVAGSSPSAPAILIVIDKFMVKNIKIKISLFKFLHQVKQEFFKLTWPSRKRAGISTVMVFVMIFVMAIYFFFLDWILSSVVNLLLKLG